MFYFASIFSHKFHFVFQVSANYSSTLVCSKYGGCDITGNLDIASTGWSRSFKLENITMFVVGASTSLGLPMNNDIEQWVSGESFHMSIPFNVSLPNVEGLYAHDESFAISPTPLYIQPNDTVIGASPSLVPSPIPTLQPTLICENTEGVTCPPDSYVNCSFCPTIIRMGASYPCYRASRLSFESGRCLSEAGTSARFNDNEDVDIVILTSLQISENSHSTTVSRYVSFFSFSFSFHQITINYTPPPPSFLLPFCSMLSNPVGQF